MGRPVLLRHRDHRCGRRRLYHVPRRLDDGVESFTSSADMENAITILSDHWITLPCSDPTKSIERKTPPLIPSWTSPDRVIWRTAALLFLSTQRWSLSYRMVTPGIKLEMKHVHPRHDW